jgi:hypothetical protein
MPDSVLSANRFTFREWHAAVLGGVVGALAAYLHRIEFSVVGVSLAVLFVLGALGKRVYDGSVAGRTITKEPWYALAAFALAGALVLAVL